jgi:hypothetical protein
MSVPRTSLLPRIAFLHFAIAAIAWNLADFTNSALAADVSGTSWEKDVRPILKRHCFHCHGEEETHEGKLDVRLARTTIAGGDSGAAVVAGKPDESLLLMRVVSGEMPPKDKKLSAAEQETLRRWIAEGAKTNRPEPADPATAFITDEERSFWSFQPVKRPAIPVVKNGGLVRNEIDAFLLKRLEDQGLTYSPEAERAVLIRRLSFDVRGLPPTPDEVDAFVADTSIDAWERLVDRMLASPHYGERWGRHWLDVAGYADSEGYTDDDTIRQEAWKYRDYVIRSFNEDKPYDRFVIEQLAGDELLTPPYANLNPQQIELLTATGFLRMAPDGTGGGVEQGVARNQVIADTLQIATSSLLGMTVACAQCHNHRYDPIPQTDYYRMRAIFEPAFNLVTWRNPLGRRISLYTDDDRKRSAEIEAEAAKVMSEREKVQNAAIAATVEKELAKLPDDKREIVRAARNAPEKDRTPEQQALLKEHPSVNVTAGSLYLYDSKAAAELKKMAEDADRIRGTKPVEEFIRALTEIPGQIPESKLRYRGDPEQPRQTMSPGELTIADVHADQPLTLDDPAIPTSGRRLAYAHRLVDGKHPLTARVFVNRVWMHHFGRGIVATPADFGQLGDRPTHPELLDWLADYFQSPTASPGATADAASPTRWSIKRLHRQLLNSTAYRQSSHRTPELEAVDPDNKLLARMSVRRLESEAVRDAILAANGTMTTKWYGPPVPVMQDEVGQIVLGIENLNGENRPDKIIPLNGEEFRRSIYVQVRRSRPLGVLETFDAPQMTPNCESRSASTVATQSLLLMNSDAVLTAAEQFATHMEKTSSADAAAQGQLAWRLAYGTVPTADEQAQIASFLTTQTERFRAKLPAAPAAGAAPAAKPGDAKPVDPAHQAMTIFCQALLSSNRFLYVD